MVKRIVLAIVWVFVLTCPAAARDKVQVELLGTKMGTGGYAICHGLSDIVNKHHPWLRVTATETLGTSDSLKSLIKLPPEKKKYTFSTAMDNDFVRAKAGKAPYKRKAEDVRFVARYFDAVLFQVTFHEDVKKKEDVIGKKVVLGGRGSGISHQLEFMVRDCWGIYDKIKPKYLGFRAGKDAFVDKLVDVHPGIFLAVGPKIVPNPVMRQALATVKPIFALEVTKEDFEKGKVRNPLAPYGWRIAKKDSFKKGFPSRDVGAVTSAVGWVASAHTDEEVIYELVKMMIQNYKLFKEYHPTGRGISPKILANVPYISEKDVHPGALKAYKEFGIKVGTK